MEEMQEDFEEAVGISERGLYTTLGFLFLIFLCVAIPICYMMRREEANREAAKVVKNRPKIQAADETGIEMEETDRDLESTV